MLSEESAEEVKHKGMDKFEIGKSYRLIDKNWLDVNVNREMYYKHFRGDVVFLDPEKFKYDHVACIESNTSIFINGKTNDRSCFELVEDDTSNPSQRHPSDDLDAILNEHTHNRPEHSQELTEVSMAPLIVEDGSNLDTRKDILLQVQQLCREHDVQIQIYGDEIVMNHVGYDDEFCVKNIDDVMQIVGAFEALGKFKRG